MKLRLKILVILVCGMIAFSPAIITDAASNEAVSASEAVKPKARSVYKPYKISFPGNKGKRYEREVRRILAGVDKKWKLVEKLLYLHDYLITNTTYAYGYGTEPDYGRAFAYDAVVRHLSICNGYAEAFYDIANRMGIVYVCYQIHPSGNLNRNTGFL